MVGTETDMWLFELPTQNSHCEHVQFELELELRRNVFETVRRILQMSRSWRMCAFFNSGMLACYQRVMFVRCMYFCGTKTTSACWIRGVCPRLT